MKRILTILFFFFCIGLVKAQSYDYLIIAPDIFIQNATWDDDLLSLQTSRGFNPVIEVVTVNTTAQTIKNNISNYYNNHPLKYVLLMGSGKNLADPEYKDDPNIPYGYKQHGIVNTQVDYINGTFIPFFSAESNNPWEPSGIEYVASDDPYTADLTNHGPVYIGRVPVTSVTEANNYVDKLEIYYQYLSNYSEAMNKEILLNIDVTTSSGSCTGELVTQINDELISEHIPAGTSIVELNVSEHNYCPTFQPYTYCPQRQTTFITNLNQGAAIVSILGTSGGTESFGGWFWAYDNSSGSPPYDELTFNTLQNKYTGMPFLIAPNCHQGEVNNPDDHLSTTRKLMVYNNGGIIGAIAPTVGSEQHENGYILNRFNDLIFQDEAKTYGEIFNILKGEMFINFPAMEFYNNGLTYFGDPSLVPSITKHRSGTISSSQTWSGNFIIDGNLAIPSGVNLTILPGTNLFLKNNSSMNVNGTLDATGISYSRITFKPQSGSSPNSWGSITFSGSGAAGSTIEFANIEYGTRVEAISTSNITIQNCAITNTYDGVRFYGSTGSILNNTITTNSAGHGIIIEGSTVTCNDNIITKTSTSRSGVGIHIVSGSGGHFGRNDISWLGLGNRSNLEFFPAFLDKLSTEEQSG